MRVLTPGGAVVVVVAPAVRSVCAHTSAQPAVTFRTAAEIAWAAALTVGDDEVVVQPRVLGLRGGGRAVLAADVAQVRCGKKNTHGLRQPVAVRPEGQKGWVDSRWRSQPEIVRLLVLARRAATKSRKHR